MAMFGPILSHFIRRAVPHGGVGEEPRRGGRREQRAQRHVSPWETGRQYTMHAMARRGKVMMRVAGGRDAADMRVWSAIVQLPTCSLVHAATTALTTHIEAAPKSQHTLACADLNVRVVMRECGLKLRRVEWRWRRRRGLKQWRERLAAAAVVGGRGFGLCARTGLREAGIAPEDQVSADVFLVTADIVQFEGAKDGKRLFVLAPAWGSRAI